MAKTYTSVPNVATGDVYTASTYNTMTAQNINNLRVPPMCRANRSTDQNISNNSTTALDFTSADSFDTDAMHDPSSNSTRVYANTTGVYLIIANCLWGTGSSTGRRNISISVNGAGINASEDNGPSDAQTANQSVSALQSLTAGDYVTLDLYQNSGGTRTAQGSLSLLWVGQVS